MTNSLISLSVKLLGASSMASGYQRPDCRKAPYDWFLRSSFVVNVPSGPRPDN